MGVLELSRNISKCELWGHIEPERLQQISENEGKFEKVSPFVMRKTENLMIRFSEQFKLTTMLTIHNQHYEEVYHG
jgi:hypothetical protein